MTCWPSTVDLRGVPDRQGGPMFEVTVDHDIIEQLASRLELLSTGLTHPEWTHLVALLGLGSTGVADAARTGAELPFTAPRRGVVFMESPGFADVLSPAADAVGILNARDHRIVIVNHPDISRWEVISGADLARVDPGVQAGHASTSPTATKGGGAR